MIVTKPDDCKNVPTKAMDVKKRGIETVKPQIMNQNQRHYP